MKALIFTLALFLGACSSTGIGDRCEDDESCPEGQYCARVAVCTQSCATSACPEGSSCQTIDGRAVCLKTCSQDDECNETEGCREGVCHIVDPLKPF